MKIIRLDVVAGDSYWHWAQPGTILRVESGETFELFRKKFRGLTGPDLLDNWTFWVKRRTASESS